MLPDFQQKNGKGILPWLLHFVSETMPHILQTSNIQYFFPTTCHNCKPIAGQNDYAKHRPYVVAISGDVRPLQFAMPRCKAQHWTITMKNCKRSAIDTLLAQNILLTKFVTHAIRFINGCWCCLVAWRCFLYLKFWGKIWHAQLFEKL